MSTPFVAGRFTSEPVRVHVYTNIGKYMLVDENNGGCWTDPEGRVVLPSLELVDRVLKAHGYVRDEMVVRKIATLPEPTPPAKTESRCTICKAVLDNPDDPVGSHDCGGDCLRCMAEAGDPDCLASAVAERLNRHDGTPFKAAEPEAAPLSPSPAPAPAPKSSVKSSRKKS